MMKIKTEMNAMVLMSIMVISLLLIASPLFAETGTGDITEGAVRALEQGRSYHIQGNYRQAIQEYDKFLRVVPGNADACYRRGTAYDKLGDLNRARQDFDKAISINPRYIEAYNSRGALYDKLGDLNRALLDFDKAILLRPSFAEAYNNRGTVYVKLGNLERGLKNFYSAIAWDPNFADAYYNRGTLYHRLGSFNQAMKDFNKAIELNHKYAIAYHNRGVIYGKLGNRHKETEDFAKAIEFDAHLGETYYIRESALNKPVDNGNRMKPNRDVNGLKSMAAPRQEPEITKELKEIQKRLDELSTENGRLRKELTVSTAPKRRDLDSYDSIARKNPVKKGTGKEYNKGAIAWNEKSYESVKLGHSDEVIRTSSIAISIDPTYPAPYINRSWAYLEKGFLDEAFDDCEKALELDSANSVAHNNRGLFYLRTKQPDRAKSDFTAACNAGLAVACNNLKVVK